MHAAPLALLVVATLSIGSRPATAGEGTAKRRYTLAQLLQRAHDRYPGVQAAREAISAMEAQVFRAKWAWLPQAQLKGLLAPAPEVRCLPSEQECTSTAQVDASSINISGVMARVTIEGGMPLYTFDKLGAAKRAARAGLRLRQAQLRSAVEDITLKVNKAYWAVKLARELLYTIKEGRKHLDKALTRIEDEIDNEKGDATVTDLLRLKTVAAEIDSRVAEAHKLETLALAGLATLTGIELETLELDKPILQPLSGKPAPVKTYVDLATQHRPEVKVLDWAMRAREASVDLERARLLPDFALVGMFGYGVATGVDDPKNAFLSDPFNFLSAGFGLGLSWKLDTVQQVGKLRLAKAQTRETAAKRREAMAGIELEIMVKVTELDEALERLRATKKGEKAARSWLVATSQAMTAGLAEAKDLTDALVAYFQLRVKYLQAMFDVNVGWAALGRTIGVAARKHAAAH